MKSAIPGQEYVETMLVKGRSEHEIRQKLKQRRWYDDEIDAAFGKSDPDTAPVAPHERTQAVAPATAHTGGQPSSVVERSSTLGIEYAVMFLALGIGAISLGSMFHNWLDVASGLTDMFENPLAMAAVIIALPIFAVLFLRLRRIEQARPEVRADSSRRKWIQITLLVSFLIGLGHIIWYVYNLLNGYGGYQEFSYSGESQPSLSTGAYQLLQFGHLAVTLLIAGSIFAYYWIDEHKQKQ